MKTIEKLPYTVPKADCIVLEIEDSLTASQENDNNFGIEDLYGNS